MKNFKSTNKSFFIFLVSGIMLLACQSENKADAITANATADSVTTNALPLPEMKLNMEQFGQTDISNEQPLSVSEQQQLQVSEIDKPLYEEDIAAFTYYLLKEMYNGKEGKILLISRTAEMEVFAWLASYNPQGKLIDFKNVYYDEFAEGAKNKTSIIHDNRIQIRQYEMDLGSGEESVQTKTFEIGSNLKFTLIQP